MRWWPDAHHLEEEKDRLYWVMRGAMSTPWNGGRGTHLGCARPHLLGATQLVGAPGRNLEQRRYHWT